MESARHAEVHSLEALACTPNAVNPGKFNKLANIPFGCTVEHINSAMKDFISFLGFINGQLATRNMQRLESFMMPANFSSLVALSFEPFSIALA